MKKPVHNLITNAKKNYKSNDKMRITYFRYSK
jgi:hypothetical protein